MHSLGAQLHRCSVCFLIFQIYILILAFTTTTLLNHSLAELQISTTSLLDEPKPEHSCPVCAELLTEPILTDCGHHVCGTCHEKLLTTNKKDCPVCRETNGLSDARLDKHFQREVNSLRVRCEYHDKGCEWVSEVRDLQNHLDPERGNCSYVMEHTQQTTCECSIKIILT